MMKKNFKLLLIAAVTFLAFHACTNKSKQSDAESTTGTEFVDEHTSQNSLDWAGTYSGVLPCADCEGIETELTLNSDNTYALKTSYLGVDDPLTDVLEGSFVWLEDGNSVKLEGIADGSRSPFFKVEENQVRYLDLEGNTITGALEQHYILTKQ